MRSLIAAARKWLAGPVREPPPPYEGPLVKWSAMQAEDELKRKFRDTLTELSDAHAAERCGSETKYIVTTEDVWASLPEACERMRVVAAGKLRVSRVDGDAD